MAPGWDISQQTAGLVGCFQFAALSLNTADRPQNSLCTKASGRSSSNKKWSDFEGSGNLGALGRMTYGTFPTGLQKVWWGWGGLCYFILHILYYTRLWKCGLQFGYRTISALVSPRKYKHCANNRLTDACAKLKYTGCQELPCMGWFGCRHYWVYTEKVGFNTF